MTDRILSCTMRQFIRVVMSTSWPMNRNIKYLNPLDKKEDASTHKHPPVKSPLSCTWNPCLPGVNPPTLISINTASWHDACVNVMSIKTKRKFFIYYKLLYSPNNDTTTTLVFLEKTKRLLTSINSFWQSQSDNGFSWFNIFCISSTTHHTNYQTNWRQFHCLIGGNARSRLLRFKWLYQTENNNNKVLSGRSCNALVSPTKYHTTTTI